VRKGGATRKEVIDAEVPMPYAGQVQAVRAGDLLFLSNLMAVKSRGALAVSADAAAQMDYMLAGGTPVPQSRHNPRQRRARTAIPYRPG
jgi:hypothetical protein